MPTTLPDTTPWHDAGFAEKPEEKVATGGEAIYRAYGGTSGYWGNYFFVPAIDHTPISYWTAEMLEVELNAALWGNDFAGVIKFEMLPKARYQIGPIAHHDYVGQDGGRRFIQRSFITPSGIFKQVRVFASEGAGLDSSVKMVASVLLKAGRYAREASRRAKQYKQ